MNQRKKTEKNQDTNNQEEDQNINSANTENGRSNENTATNEKDDSKNEENLDNHENETQDEIKVLKDQLLRSLAENENLRKRTAKEIEQIKKYGHISLLRDFLNVVDNLERAVKSSTSENQTESGMKNLIDGIEIVLKEMKSLLDKNQIKKIEPLHEKFDYNFHQAMFEAPSSDYEEGLIIEVVQPGYVLHDRLIRPAMVGVSKGEIVEKEKKDE
ncbi:nucleotide exchange factor GrpE [Alphaproteobacteria bacterium]|nr:nucleotide exchange factor GrpE [Alphaproteobacteria bacterium]